VLSSKPTPNATFDVGLVQDDEPAMRNPESLVVIAPEMGSSRRSGGCRYISIIGTPVVGAALLAAG
jgi:hypothetical protein